MRNKFLVIFVHHIVKSLFSEEKLKVIYQYLNLKWSRDLKIVAKNEKLSIFHVFLWDTDNRWL